MAIYSVEDIKPELVSVENIKPELVSVEDTKPKLIAVDDTFEPRRWTKTLQQGEPMGLLLALTYPEELTFTTTYHP